MKSKLLTRLNFIFVWALFALGCKQTDWAPKAQPENEEVSILPFAGSGPGKTSEMSKEENADTAAKVWVCKSSGATKYHYNQNCSGLKRCSHTVEASTVKEAEAIGLTQCGYKKCK